MLRTDVVCQTSSSVLPVLFATAVWNSSLTDLFPERETPEALCLSHLANMDCSCLGHVICIQWIVVIKGKRPVI